MGRDTLQAEPFLAVHMLRSVSYQLKKAIKEALLAGWERERRSRKWRKITAEFFKKLFTWTPVVVLSRSLWFSSGFVAFPSIHKSINSPLKKSREGAPSLFFLGEEGLYTGYETQHWSVLSTLLPVKASNVQRGLLSRKRLVLVLKAGVHMKAVFWLVIMVLTQMSRLRFKQSRISMLTYLCFGPFCKFWGDF